MRSRSFGWRLNAGEKCKTTTGWVRGRGRRGTGNRMGAAHGFVGTLVGTTRPPIHSCMEMRGPADAEWGNRERM